MHHDVDKADGPKFFPSSQRLAFKFLWFLQQELNDLVGQLRNKLLLVEKLVGYLPIFELIGKTYFVFDRCKLRVNLEIIPEEIDHQLKLLGVSVHKNFHYLTFFDPLK